MIQQNNKKTSLVMDDIQNAIKLSDDILSALDTNDLALISEIDVKRVEQIKACFNADKQVDQASLQELKQKNDNILGLLLTLKKNTQQQQQDLNIAQKASKAYLDNI